jgi:predicted MFS family arabinose efflux permease
VDGETTSAANPAQSEAEIAVEPVATFRREVVQLGALFATFYFLQGICEPTEGMLSQPIMSLLKSWKYDAGEIGRFTFILGLPWAVKLLYGLLTDFVPIFGNRRKPYLLLMSGASTCGFAALTLGPLEPAEKYFLLIALLVSSIGVAFCDVVIDAVMVERGQPLGATGKLQSVQWTSIYAAAILGGYIGGTLSQSGDQRFAFAICAVVTFVTFLLAAIFVRERHYSPLPTFDRETRRQIQADFRGSQIWAIAAFLYLWTFNPFSNKVLYVHMTRDADFSESFFGQTQSVLAFGQLLGALAYGFYCRRVPWRWLVHASIIMGIVSTAAYWWLSGEASAYSISLFVGVSYSTGNLIQLDLAARHCPPQAAGTTFAVLMAVSNLGISSADWIGGTLYEYWQGWGPNGAFHALVVVGCITTAGCWVFVPWLVRDVPAPADIA